MVVAITGLLTFLYASHVWPFQNSPTPSPTPSPSQTTSAFHVVEAILRADPFNYSGACPVSINFSGRISAVGSGTVSYRFIRSDGASAPIQTLTFTGSASQDVSETWTLGGAGTRYSGWEAIRIVDPNAMDSSHATFTLV